MADLVKVGRDTKGRDALLHPVAAELWLLTVARVNHRLGIDLSKRMVQALGDAAASAGVHGEPAVCMDIRTRGLTTTQIKALVDELRECGWEGTWYRDWVNNQHIHAATDIGAWTPALYQVKAARKGKDGLGAGGTKGNDPHPAPRVRRTAKQGIAWLKSLEVVEDDFMAMTPAERKALVDDIAAASAVAVHGQWLGRSGPAVGTALQGAFNATQRIEAKLEAMTALLSAAGGDLDVAAMQRVADEAVEAYGKRLAESVASA